MISYEVIALEEVSFSGKFHFTKKNYSFARTRINSINGIAVSRSALMISSEIKYLSRPAFVYRESTVRAQIQISTLWRYIYRNR